MNAHNKIWGSRINNARGISFQRQLMEEHGYTLLNDGSPTYHCPRNGSKTNIDLSFCSPDIALQFEWTTLNFGTSDHLPIMTTLNNNNFSLPSRPQKFAYRRANWDKFARTTEIEAVNINKTEMDINNLNNNIVDVINKGKFAAIPTIKFKPYKSLQPSWWNKEARLAIATLHKAKQKMRQSLLPSDRLAYRIAYAISKRTSRKAKRENFRSRCAALGKGTSLNWVWKLARFQEGQYATIPALNLASNIIVFSNKERAQALLSTFFQPTTISDARKEAILLWSGPTPNPDRPYNLPFQLWELEAAIWHLKISAEGPDEVHNLCIKHVPANLKLIILNLINRSLESGTIPDKWQDTKVIPLLKPGKNKSNPAAYMPISLSSCLLKLMDRMILKRLEYALTEAGANCRQQFGFKKGSGTTEALTILTSEAQTAKQNGKVMILAFLDVQRAFDGVWHEAVVARLKFWGIGGSMLTWITSFLKSRSYQLTIGNHTATATPTSGVPQGAVLSPRLFSIVIDGMVEAFPKAVKGILYADDSTLAMVSKSAEVAYTRMQSALDAASNYGKEWGLPCSREKTDYMVITSQKKINNNLTLTMDGHQLPRISSKKVLGVIIDSQLSWKEQLQYIKSKTTKSLNLLRSLACKSWGADRETLLLLYKQLVRSRLEYGSTSFASATQRNLAILEPIQNSAIRIATSNAALQVEAGCPPLQQRRDLAILKTFCKAAATSSPLWQDSQGLPHYRWKEDKSPGYIRALHLIAELNNNNAFSKIEEENQENPSPPWEAPHPLSIEVDWLDRKKGDYNPATLAVMAEAQISNYGPCTHIFTDGSKTINACGIGIYCPNTDSNLSERCPTELSIMNVELLAINQALLQARKIPNSSNETILIISDSKSALQLLRHKNKHNSTTNSILKLVQLFRAVHFLWVPSHIGIKGNENADKLAAEATTLQVTRNNKIPRPDMILYLKNALHSRWRQNWAMETKGRVLHDINPDILPWKHSTSRSRLEQQLLSTMRCGRAKLPAHRFRLNKTTHPSCPDCGVLGTLHHYLVVCKNYHRQRRALQEEVRKAGLAFNTKNILGGSQAPMTTNNAILNRLMTFVKETVGYKTILGWD